MPDQSGTLEHVAVELAGVLSSVTNRFGDQGVLDTFDQLGVHFPDDLLTNATISAARRTIVNVGGELAGLTANLTTAIDAGDDVGIVTAGAALLTQCARVTAAFPELAAALTSAGPTLPGITAAQISALVDGLPRKITDLLLADLLQLDTVTAAVLETFGVLQRDFHDGDPADPTRPPYEAITVHGDRLLPAITDPVGRLKALYGWGSGSFDPSALLTVLESAFAGAFLPVLFTPGTATTPPRLEALSLTLEPTADGTGLSLGLALPIEGQGGFDVPLSPPAWSAHVSLTGEVPAAATGEIRPPGTLSLTGDVIAAATVGVRATPAEPFVLLGVTGGSRLEFASASLDGGLTLALDPATGNAVATPTADGEITGGKLVIDTTGGDGFVATVLGDLRVESDFSVGFTFTPDAGVRFHGSGGLEIQIPVHLQVGPVEVQALYLRAVPSDGEVKVELSAAFAASLGPVQVSVDRLGVSADLTFPDGGGNLGPADLAFGFKPPTGAGIAVDAGPVSGGGFLSYDPDRGEYAGAVELQFADFLAISGIGLITTRMPDGSKGFSLLVVLTADFGEAGIQLGFGFRLLAVGGLLGLNRGMRTQAIMDGVRTGAIESLMFPRDVVANAPRILSDLAAFFPPQNGVFLIGPMAKIAWGTPTLVSASVAVIIEVPGDIAILGVLKVALPTEDDPLLLLQVNFAGVIDFDRQRVYFFAALFKSSVLGTTIDGEMGVLTGFASQKDLVITVGGFHPKFTPPPLPFQTPKRVVLHLLNSSAARVTLTGYFAITANTAQFGADVDLFFGFSDLNLQGGSSFDALFQRSPFHMTAHLGGHVSLNVFGAGLISVKLDATLSGPGPWNVSGSASISLFFFDIGVDFDKTWGTPLDTTLPPVAVLPLLSAELAKPQSWRTKQPVSGAPLVTLRTLAPDEADIVLHPLGTLVVSQQVVPLDIKIDRVGAQRAVDVSRVSMSVPTGLAKLADESEPFALGQYQNLTDAQLLALPSYEREHAGLELGPDGAALASSRAVRRTARYEQIVIDSIAREQTHFADFHPALFTHFLGGASVTRSPLAQAERTFRQPFADGVAVTGESFAVASVLDNSAAGPLFGTEAQARSHLSDLLATDPSKTDSLHVIPAVEVL
ncbi:DUF6603 domain-containing protein [Actinomadura scrupuli]|uniref:DUF6603 domain-containing protein n=1 Tax=Actinomadura scrupuli TaxID=559629 RepID=UPI003D977456